MKGFLDITKIILPKRCVEQTISHLRNLGLCGLEGFALWAGVAHGNTFYTHYTYIPAQEAMSSESGVCVRVDGDELHRINVWLFENSLRLIAQIHSHPSNAYHSETDNTYPIATTLGSLSLVIPDFAQKEFSLDQCAVYRLLPPGVWTELKPEEVRRLIILEETL